MRAVMSHAPLLARWRPRATSARPSQRGASLLARLEQWLWRAQQRELEVRLSGCADIADVERVLRHIERIRPHYRYD